MSERDEQLPFPLPFGIPQQSLNGIMLEYNPLLPYMYPVIDPDLDEDEAETDLPDID